MGLVYAGCLVAGLAAMAAVDARWRLFVFSGQPVRALVTLVVGVVFFILWDVAGIGLGVFFRGGGPYLSGLVLGPEFPVEELLFLTFLCWLTMDLWVLGTRLLTVGRPGPRRRVVQTKGAEDTVAGERVVGDR